MAAGAGFAWSEASAASRSEAGAIWAHAGSVRDGAGLSATNFTTPGAGSVYAGHEAARRTRRKRGRPTIDAAAMNRWSGGGWCRRRGGISVGSCGPERSTVAALRMSDVGGIAGSRQSARSSRSRAAGNLRHEDHGHKRAASVSRSPPSRSFSITRATDHLRSTRTVFLRRDKPMSVGAAPLANRNRSP